MKTKNFTKIFGMMVFLLLAIVPIAFAGSWSGTVVEDVSGVPLTGVTVSALFGGVVVSSTTTDVNGVFTVANLLQNGSYTLSFNGNGYLQTNRSGLPVINNSDATKKDLTFPFDFTLQTDGTLCVASSVTGGWSNIDCGTRTITTANSSNICGYTTTSTESQGCSSGGNTGGHSSGGSGSGSGTTSGVLSGVEHNCLKGDIDSISKNDVIIIPFNGINYTFFIKDILQTSTKLKMYPIPSRDYSFKEGEALKIDLDRNNRDDFYIKLEEVKSPKAKISCRLLTTDAQPEQAEKPVIETVTEVVSNLKEGVLKIVSNIIPREGASPLVGTLIAIAIVAAGLVAYFILRKGEDDEDFDDDFDDNLDL